MNEVYYSEDGIHPRSTGLERVYLGRAPSALPPPAFTKVQLPTISSPLLRRRMKANRRKTRPTQGDWVLIREMFPKQLLSSSFNQHDQFHPREHHIDDAMPPNSDLSNAMSWPFQPEMENDERFVDELQGRWQARDYSSVERPRRETAGVPHQNTTRPTASGDILNQVVPTDEAKRKLQQQRKNREEYPDNLWKCPHEPPAQTKRLKIESGQVTQVSGIAQSLRIKPDSTSKGIRHQLQRVEHSDLFVGPFLYPSNVSDRRLNRTISEDQTCFDGLARRRLQFVALRGGSRHVQPHR